jgi:hypothetical protein
MKVESHEMLGELINKAAYYILDEIPENLKSVTLVSTLSNDKLSLNAQLITDSGKSVLRALGPNIGEACFKIFDYFQDNNEPLVELRIKVFKSGNEWEVESNFIH